MVYQKAGLKNEMENFEDRDPGQFEKSSSCLISYCMNKLMKTKFT